MDCYGWLIAPFQLLSFTQKRQAEAKIMDLFSTHPLWSISDCDHRCMMGVSVCLYVFLRACGKVLSLLECVKKKVRLRETRECVIFLVNGLINITFPLTKMFI